MSATPIAGRPFRRTVAAVLLAAGYVVAPLPSPAAAQNVPAEPPSSPPPGQYLYYAQYGQYKPYYCYSYPANCTQPLPYPFYSYPPSYNLSPHYDYAWPHGGGAGFGIIVGPVFGFAPGIVLPRRFIIRRGIHVHRVIRR